jgi:L-lactate utilization protein LutB
LHNYAYKPLQPDTHFKFPEDEGSFSRATLRCIGLGACRKSDSGTMCPSYRATLEEEHAPRGRAHMLFELLQGEVVKGAWKDEHVEASLELCLSCKPCKSECPVNVDIATYKAEFLSHYYENRPRPGRCYVYAWIDKWARLGSGVPTLSNWLTHAPGVSQAIKNCLSMAWERQFPKFAPQTFRSWARHNGIPLIGRKPYSQSHTQKESAGRAIL